MLTAKQSNLSPIRISRLYASSLGFHGCTSQLWNFVFEAIDKCTSIKCSNLRFSSLVMQCLFLEQLFSMLKLVVSIDTKEGKELLKDAKS